MSFKTLFSVSILLLLLLGCVSEPAKEDSPRDLEIRINNGHDITSTADVELSLFARHASECRFSNDGDSWGSWEPYAREKSWTLEGADGRKQVFFQCRNSAGALSPVVSESIDMDSTAPAIHLSSPENGKTYSNSVELAFNVSDSGSDTVSCNAVIGNTIQNLGVLHTDRAQSVFISLSSGEKTLVLNCSDGIHTTLANATFTMKKGPSLSFTINDGSEYTDNANVTLAISSPSATECRFSRDSSQWGSWQPFGETVQWTLKGSDGKKRVFVQCRNSDGAESEIEEDSIILDTRPPPYISLSINNGAAWTSSQNVSLGLYAYSAKECHFSNDGQDWGPWEVYSKKKSWNLTDGEGRKTVFYECKNKTGGDLGLVSAMIYYSAIPQIYPTNLSIIINDGEEYSASTTLQLSLSAMAAFECRLREGNLNWTQWKNFNSSETFTVSANEGAKTIYYQCRNSHGSATVFDRIYLDWTAPSEVKNLKAEASPYSVVLSWGAASDSGSGVESYSIFRKVDSTWKWVGTTHGLSYKDEIVVSGEPYEYKVQALDFNRNLGLALNVTVQVPEED
jgi:hypothetical protein